MAATEDQILLLDQLQSQLNQVLEQTGRVFAAMNANPKERPIAQAAKLKNIFPGATDRFHQALDQLENELQMAMTVMRRDLALCRERTGQQAQAQAPQVHSNGNGGMNGETEHATEDSGAMSTNPAASELDKTQADRDITMQEAPEPPNAIPATEDEEVLPNAKLTDKPPATESDAKSKDVPMPDAKPTAEEQQDSNSGPDLGTQKEESNTTEDQKAPDTAADTTNDLDSLFNDTASAGGVGPDNNEFNFDQSGSGDIDFGSFNASFDNNTDNDNISSLLPGLEDYANPQPNASEDVDLNELLNLGSASAAGGDAQHNGGAGAQPPGDTTFEDLMDLANFDGGSMEGDGNAKENAAGKNGANDFDFESLFS